MFKFLRKMKGQSTLEYAVLIIIIIGALLAIQVYIKRGLQGRLRSATDDIGDQFSPGNTNAVKTTITNSATTERSTQSTPRNSTLSRTETTDVDFQQNIINVEQEFWGRPR